jgi:hypothetical protein
MYKSKKALGTHDQVPREPKRGRVKQLGKDPRSQKMGVNQDEFPCNAAVF